MCMEGVGERTTEMGNELDSLASLNPRHTPCYVAPPVSGTEHPTQEQSEGERRGDQTHRASILNIFRHATLQYIKQ